MDIFSKRHIPFILIIIALIVYLSTICPTVYPGDSGELTVAAYSLGIPHPSGYPLYALLGKLFCLQTVSAEVYPLHTFFVALLIRILISWDEKRDIRYLALFAFITGLSFLNHLQTIMLAPSVLFFLIVSDRKDFLNLKTSIILSILFLVALTVYTYLPIRTNAGAAIHWGDPYTLKIFFDVACG